MKKYFSTKRISLVVPTLTIFGFLSVSCTDFFKGLLPFDIEDHWQLDQFDDEDKELVKGKWILKKMGYESWDDVDNPYVNTDNVPQISHIESLQIDIEGEHMMLTFNFNRPTLVTYYTPSTVDEGYHIEETWKTSLTLPHGLCVTACFDWETSSVVSGSDYDYNGEAFRIYEYKEDEAGTYCQSCYDYTFLCIFEPKNLVTDEKGEIKRLIMSSGHNYHYEFERK